MAPNGVGSRPRLVLASASPRRRQLLEAAGLPFELTRADIDETPEADEAPGPLVERLARTKAEAGLASLEDPSRAVVLGADTVVALDDEIFGKPTCAAEARTMLSRLSGSTHHIFTGVAVATPARTEAVVETTVVWFRRLDAAEIDCYVATGEPMDKAGAYAIQGRAGMFVERIDGSFHSAVGLPLHVVDRLCRSVGLDLTARLVDATTGECTS
ncbi:MAG: Maf family protein [Actinomycetota bacterium]